MIPGMNARKMQQAMKRMGIAQQEIDATEVIIKTPTKNIVITDPQVSKVNMMGQQTFQIVGSIHEEQLNSTPEISEEDIQTIMDQTGVNADKAKETLEKHEGDLAAAIMALK